MPYVTTTKTRTAYRDAYVTREQDTGFDLIPICRPNFVFFQFTGLRPSTPHWMFFDGVDVTKWVNTSYTINDYNNAIRNSDLRTPGDKFINETAFPVSLGGPTAASGPINSSAAGTVEGVFYLQSNTTLSFNTGRRVLTVMDISVLNKDNCLSYAEAEYSAIGQQQLYYEYQQVYQEQYVETYTEQTYIAPVIDDNDDWNGGSFGSVKENSPSRDRDDNQDYSSGGITSSKAPKAKPSNLGNTSSKSIGERMAKEDANQAVRDRYESWADYDN
jgi:hypothetical protein